MKKNNYNTNTSGLNLELICGLDTFGAQELWKENFERVENSEHLFIYTDYGQDAALSYPSECFDLSNADRKACRAYCIGHECTGGTYDKSPREVVETMFRDYDSWQDYAAACVDESGFEELAREGFPDIQGARRLWDCADITGYCQGDFASVFYKISSEYDQSGLSESFAHLFYDAPIYCRLELDGAEFYLEHELGCGYSWDVDKIKEAARGLLARHFESIARPIDYLRRAALRESVKTAAAVDYCLNWLGDNLPEYPAAD